MSILVLNAGSSTLKLALCDDAADQELARGLIEWGGSGHAAQGTLQVTGRAPQRSRLNVANVAEGVGWILRSLREAGFEEPVRGVGHRVVHGGTEFRHPTVVDDQVRRALEEISELAPLHNPAALTVIREASRAVPDAIQVAVFDTAFFADLPPRAFLYPVPYEWHQRYGIRRFGFHGISHAYCAKRAAELLGRPGDPSLRLVTCHLGNGCSATAVQGGRPSATTMGFTPMDGLMMGTRSGSIDPGILIHLVQRQGFDANVLEESLNRRSGLLGISGVSADFRQVEQAAATGNPRARLAIEMFSDRVRSTIGSLSVTLGGIDGLVFTAGIGEHSATLRRHVCQGLQCLGLHLDEDKNERSQGDGDLATAASPARILGIQTREERTIAQEVVQCLADRAGARRDAASRSEGIGG
jgi:acetate kinase